MTSRNQTSNTQLPTIGILGDGQLAMMMAEAYQHMGGQVFIFGTSDCGPASGVADRVFVGEPGQLESLRLFFDAVDIVTLENEFYDSHLLSDASSQFSTPIFPSPDRFRLIEDKLSEKQFLQSLGIDLARFYEVKNESCLEDISGYLKVSKGGYDGIGTYRVANRNQAVEIFDRIKSAGTILFEQKVDFLKELSLIAVTDSNEVIFYPMVETHQEEGTCRYVTFPAGISQEVELQARKQVKRVLTELNTRGLFAFEFFLTKDQQLVLNEIAPRPHNSGHITIDLMDCSQFENHMRAVAGLTLREPQAIRDSMLMANLLGTQTGVFDPEKVTNKINDSESNLMLYSKKYSRIKRKMGHINLWGSNQRQRAQELIRCLEI